MKYFIINLFTLLLVTSCKNDSYTLYKIEGKQLPITESIKPNEAIENFVKPYKNHVDQEVSKALCFTPTNLVRTDGDMESSLGNLMADLWYLKGHQKHRGC